MTEVVQIIERWGPWGLLVLLVIFVLVYPERAERIGGWFLGLFSWSSKGIRQRSIKFKIQGQVNTFARSIDREAIGSMPYNMNLNFVRDIDRSELDPDKKIVIVRLKDRGADDRNVVHSMMAYCPYGVIPQARPYLSDAMNESINVTVTRKFLNYLKYYSALQYLYDDVLPKCAKDIPGLDDFCKIFDTLDDNGLFTRVILEELRDFGARIETRYPEESHGAESANFVNYVYNVATRQTGEVLVDIGYLGQHIATAFVFVGIGEKMLSKGPTLYLKHIRKLRDAGFERAYLAARGGSKGQEENTLSIDVAERVSYLAERANLAKRGRAMRYYATTRDGNTRLHILTELKMIPPPKSIN